MKSKIVILGICTLMSACGAGSKRGGMQSTQENVSGSLYLKNLSPQTYGKVQQLKSGNQYRFLGTFELSSLPESMRGLSGESEIGTLSVEFEDEKYLDKYSSEVIPVFRKRQQEVKTTVFLLRSDSLSNQFSLAIKNDGNENVLNVQEESVAVKSSPKKYCKQTHFFTKILADGMTVNDQTKTCNPLGFCTVEIYNGYFKKFDSVEYNLNTHAGLFPNKCDGYEDDYSVTENKLNRSTPMMATIRINGELVKLSTKLIFDL